MLSLKIKVNRLTFTKPLGTKYCLVFSLGPLTSQTPQTEHQSKQINFNTELEIQYTIEQSHKHRYCLLFVYVLGEYGRKILFGNVPLNISQQINQGIKTHQLIDCVDKTAIIEVELSGDDMRLKVNQYLSQKLKIFKEQNFVASGHRRTSSAREQVKQKLGSLRTSLKEVEEKFIRLKTSERKDKFLHISPSKSSENNSDLSPQSINNPIDEIRGSFVHIDQIPVSQSLQKNPIYDNYEIKFFGEQGMEKVEAVSQRFQNASEQSSACYDFQLSDTFKPINFATIKQSLISIDQKSSLAGSERQRQQPSFQQNPSKDFNKIQSNLSINSQVQISIYAQPEVISSKVQLSQLKSNPKLSFIPLQTYQTTYFSKSIQSQQQRNKSRSNISQNVICLPQDNDQVYQNIDAANTLELYAMKLKIFKDKCNFLLKANEKIIDQNRQLKKMFDSIEKQHEQLNAVKDRNAKLCEELATQKQRFRLSEKIVNQMTLQLKQKNQQLLKTAELDKQNKEMQHHIKRLKKQISQHDTQEKYLQGNSNEANDMDDSISKVGSIKKNRLKNRMSQSVQSFNNECVTSKTETHGRKIQTPSAFQQSQAPERDNIPYVRIHGRQATELELSFASGRESSCKSNAFRKNYTSSAEKFVKPKTFQIVDHLNAKAGPVVESTTEAKNPAEIPKRLRFYRPKQLEK